MIRVYCPEGHFIADVEVADGKIIAHGAEHGLFSLYAPVLGASRLHARCFARRCTYDGSIKYQVLYAQLAAAEAHGDTKYRLSH